MKTIAKLVSTASIICAVLFLTTSFGNTSHAHTIKSGRIHVPADTLEASSKMRVVFIPNSTYKNFKIGIESIIKTDVNIQVINQKGMVVFARLLEDISKKLEAVDFSFLKTGKYTVKVINQYNVYTKELIIP